MRVNWPNLALLSLVLVSLPVGCFGSHGGGADDGGADAGPDTGPRPDVGPGPDVGPRPDAAPGCTTVTPGVERLECPETARAGERITVGLTLINYGCCGGGEVRSFVSSEDFGRHDIESEMEICDCCDECDCIGPITETSVEVFLDATPEQVVVAGEQRCVIVIEDESTCRPQPATEVRMPRVIYPGQPLTVSAISSEPMGCGCQPRLDASTSGIDLRVCECCDECLCIDAGYEASALSAAPPIGEHRIPVGGSTSRELSVVSPASCNDTVDIVGLSVVGPSPFASEASPQVHWAVVTGQETTCCVEPRYGVESDRRGNDFLLTARDCTPDVDCDCVPPGPTRFMAWHPLGELAPGDYTISTGDTLQRFHVP